MTLREKILHELDRKGVVRATELSRLFGVSRVAIHKAMKQLREEGLVQVVGKTRQARYVPAKSEAVNAALKEVKHISLRLKNEALDEAAVFERIQRETGIFLGVKNNVLDICRYAFTEMLNNAIDHSRSERIVVDCRRTGTAIVFTVRDFGIGVFNNIRRTRHLPNALAAIQDLLKGKTTTMPKQHSGEGIFFTSKAVDVFVLDSFEKRLTVNNLLPDLFVSDRRPLRGTLVTCSIALQSNRVLADVFKAHTIEHDEGHAFAKTRVHIKLHDMGASFVSRSEAKRVLVNLERFEEAVLDFKDVETVGQAFADEIFRVWHDKHPEVRLIPENMNDNVEFMVRRAGGRS
ncbi:DUF4325 domain-containing protein [Candidatus Uhrbacteria bacterium]|nr:MAG: DUF4325 domain-containing protein [Candidatus Uhrbacteria bacterium]